MSDVVVFCRSRSRGRRCTRHDGHPGLHRHRTIMWTDAAADEPRCPGSGVAGVAATPLADGFPFGRALCDVCLRFVDLDDGMLVAHDTTDAAEPPGEAARRAEWLNTHGW